MSRLRRYAGWLGALSGLSLLSCASDPVAVVTGLEVVVAEGDAQFGTAGELLPTALRAVVRSEATGVPQKNVTVLWDIERGGGTLVGATTAATDSTGSVQIGLRLGAAPDEIVVRVRVASQSSATATFTAYSVEPPVLTSVAPGSAAAGDTITLSGENFRLDVGQNVVLFSGIRGRVVSATATQLRVEVPLCLPARAVSVRVQLGLVSSASLGFVVSSGGPPLDLQVGDVIDVADDGGFSCFALPGGIGPEYLTLVYSASTVGAAMHPWDLTALTSSALTAAGRGPRLATEPAQAARLAETGSAQTAWDERLRSLEGELLAERKGGSAVAAAPGPAAVPTVGQVRTFSVLNGSGGYDEVTAVAEYVGSEAAIFVDVDSPEGGFASGDLASFAARFDDVIHPEVTSAFGQTSDLDANERVVILFTPVVNAMTPRTSSSFIGGFFFGNDLLPSNPNSNGGEIFYSLVPDPTGEFSVPHTKDQVLSVVPAVLAHEFQHMVHFNERFLKLDGGQEALWLSEGLAQMAEELVARSYDELNDLSSAELFRKGVRARARIYLQSPDTVSVIVATGQGSLAERGAGFLHVMYLVDQEGPSVLGGLTRTTRTGVANVEAQTGRAWPLLLADWWTAIYMDGPGPESGRRVYQTLDLRAFLESPFPLIPEGIGPGDASFSGMLWSSSVAYFMVAPEPGESMAVRLGGAAGVTSSPQAALRMRILRVS